MATLTIRQLDDYTHAQLRARAAQHERSMEAEARAILDTEMGRPTTNILTALHEAVRETGGVDLELPARVDRPRGVDL